MLQGYQRMRILTYSTSLALIKDVAEKMDDLEIIFGREDILHRVSQYVAYQDLLLRDLKQEFHDHDVARQKIDAGTLRMFIVRDMISHEKLYLLEGDAGKRVITGSANFSERAISGKQNESFVCFDNDDDAWEFFTQKYEHIRERSTMSIAKRAVLDPDFNIEDLPIFNPETDKGTSPQIIIIEERAPQPSIIHKLLVPKIPKQYDGLSTVMTSEKGAVRLDSVARQRAVRYVKSNIRTENDNPEESLSIFPQSGRVILSGKDVDLDVKADDVRRDVGLMLHYFDGYQQFRGDTKKLTRDYFTFMSWLYISPFICDFRNRAEASYEDDIDKFDYPVFGLLYGKSNCGKFELIRWLLLSMFQREGFLPNDWFTKSQVGGLRGQNHRYPMAFDDMDKDRFSKHAIPLIKEDYIGLSEYPAIVLSMNADKDTFESEVRKRCLIIYTGSSLPDHTGESRVLGSSLKKMKRQLGDALYREYMRRVIERLDQKPPKDILEFSSRILNEIFAEYSDAHPVWGQITTMDRYVQTKHDKVKAEIGNYILHTPEAWSETGINVVLSLADIQQIRKLQKDVPDYLIANVSGNKIVFLRDELEEFLGVPVFAKRKKRWFLF